MPKYYCDYCDVYLTHDSSSVRKAHNNGKNHIMNVRNYYAELGQDKAQAIIDEITKAYERAGQSGFPPQYGYVPGIPPTPSPAVPVAAAPQFGAPAPIMLGRPPTGVGAPGTVPAPGLSAPPPGIGSAPPGMGAPGVGGPPSSAPMIDTETSPGIRPPMVSPTSLGPNSTMPSNQQYGTPTGYMRPSGQSPIGGYPTTQGPPGSQGSIPPGSVPPASVPPPGGANYQQYPGGHSSQHYPPASNGSNSSSSLPPQPSRVLTDIWQEKLLDEIRKESNSSNKVFIIRII
ncbi:Yhc1p [Rhizophagus irregularis DAOM 197198w]|uniref:U1 small nuclear ribonucleoprotein C n=1 Tax=Rhizophagus irregularis (strain DAOM 197198w) TaxID=1432141 RepID=A0A015IEQ8_RHIIW|nr:Yhc1p [Rhizophagus irregularis DAOM 197198w]